MASRQAVRGDVVAEYKLDTNVVAEWLAATAKLCTSNPSSSSSAPQQGGRLKGKARKQAKLTAEGKTTSSKDYLIPKEQWVPLARRIVASTKPKIDVPASVMNILDRAIQKRTATNHAIESLNAPGRISKVDADHRDFLRILNEVRTILGSNFKGASQSSGEKSKASSSHHVKLDVEEPSSAFLNAPDIERPKAVIADQEDSLGTKFASYAEALDSYHNLNEKLLELRRLVTNTWRQYKEGHISLTTASLANKVALDFGKQAIEDRLPQFREWGGPFRMASTHLFIEQQVSAPGKLSLKGPTWGREMMDVAHINPELSWNMGVVALALTFDLADTLKDIELNGWKLPEASPDMTPAQREIREDTEFLREYLYLSRLWLQHGLKALKGTDNLIIELDSLFKGSVEGGESSFFLAFALQVTLTIRRTLGDTKLTFPGEAMGAQLQAWREEIVLYKVANARLQWSASESYQDTLNQVIDACFNNINMVFADPIKQGLSKQGVKKDDIPSKDRLFQISPASLGMMLYNFHREIYAIRLGIANFSQTLLCLSHIHNALSQHELLDQPWDDMTCFLKSRSDELFFGDTPKDLEAINRRFWMALGVEGSVIAAVAANRLSRSTTIFNGARRQLGEHLDVLGSFDEISGPLRVVHCTEEWLREVLEKADRCDGGANRITKGETDKPKNEDEAKENLGDVSNTINELFQKLTDDMAGLAALMAPQEESSDAMADVPNIKPTTQQTLSLDTVETCHDHPEFHQITAKAASCLSSLNQSLKQMVDNARQSGALEETPTQQTMRSFTFHAEREFRLLEFPLIRFERHGWDLLERIAEAMQNTTMPYAHKRNTNPGLPIAVGMDVLGFLGLYPSLKTLKKVAKVVNQWLKEGNGRKTLDWLDAHNEAINPVSGLHHEHKEPESTPDEFKENEPSETELKKHEINECVTRGGESNADTSDGDEFNEDKSNEDESNEDASRETEFLVTEFKDHEPKVESKGNESKEDESKEDESKGEESNGDDKSNKDEVPEDGSKDEECEEGEPHADKFENAESKD